MENKELTVPYIVFESAMDKSDRRDKRNIIIIALLIVLLATTNIVWIIAWNSYDYVDTQVDDSYSVDLDADDGGNANYIGNDGDIYNGTSDGNTEKDNSNEIENEE